MVDNQQMVDFLCFSYFGIKPNCNDEEKILKCIERAYRDLNRTIKYSFSQSVLDKKSDQTLSQDARDKYIEAKNHFKNDLTKKIQEAVNSIPAAKFDDWHQTICGLIVTCNPKVEGSNVTVLKKNLTYGQAQKWVNMTLKYMWLMGLITEDVEKQLYIPIDKYILEALCKEKYEFKLFSIKRDGDTYKVSNKPSKKDSNEWYPWSEFPDKDFYYGFNKELNSLIGNNKLPIVWENDVWIKKSQPFESKES